MVLGKVANVPDSVCVGCPQNWYNECRAYLVPSSAEEADHRIHLNREGSLMNCQSRPPHIGEKYVEFGGKEVKRKS